MEIIFSLLISIFIGGVITGNILGDMKQKTAEVVFFLWKGIQVFRKRVIPSNPRSPGQIAQRAFFTAVLRLGQDVNNSVIKPFWAHLAVKMTELNAFMSYNLIAMDGTVDYAVLSYCRGSLYPTPITSATYDTVSGQTIVSWDTATQGDQEPTDIPYLVAVDENGVSVYADVVGDETRVDDSIVATLPIGLTAAKIHVYLWFANVAPGEVGFKASNSVHAVCSAP